MSMRESTKFCQSRSNSDVMTVHAQQIRDPSTRQLPLSGHIDICCQTDPKFTMFPFYKMHSESISARLAKEKHFIKCFNPKLNAL